MSSVLDKFGRRLDAAMVKYDDADPKLFEATYNPKSGLWRNKAGTVAFRNKADAEEYNKAIGILPPVDNSKVVVANNEIKTENEVRKEFNKNNYVSRNANGVSTWELMKQTADPEELKELNAIEQRHLKKRIYPKEASPAQVQTLKNKFDRYKYEHGEQKPFVKQDKKKAISAASKQYAETMTKAVVSALSPDPGTPSLAARTKEPEKSVEEIIKERSDQKLKQEQEAYDKQFGTQGIVQLKRPI
jgi:hypothetical protein